MKRIVEERTQLRMLPLFLMVATLGLCLANPGSAQDQSALTKRFFKEAPPAWEQQLDFSLTLDGGVLYGEFRTRKVGKEWRLIRTMKAYTKNWNRHMLDQWEFLESGKWSGRILGENLDYVFALERATETKPWVIVSITRKDESYQKPDRWPERKLFCEDLLLAPYATSSLPRLFPLKGFKCVCVEPESVNGEDLVRLTFTCVPEGVFRVKKGWVVLDPSHYWVIRKNEVELESREDKEGKEIWTHQVEYQEGSNNHLIPTKRILKGRIWEKGILTYEQEYVNKHAYRERPSIPKSEFTLSHFGLPEPQWSRQAKTPWFLWFGIAGIGCLVLAAGVRFFKRQRAAA